MRRRRVLVVMACVPGLLGLAGPAAAGPVPIGRQVLPAGDGWASTAPGTTGGSAAAAGDVSVVHDRAGLAAALTSPDGTPDPTPKIIYVRGRIDANTDDAGRPLSCSDYADPSYSLAAYLAAYDPAVWGRDTEVSGPLEDARARSQANQAARVRIKVGSNTTIVGVGRGAGFVGANLVLDGVDDVILRNLSFADAHDCFPQWDPTDGANGAWNSEYDTVSLFGSTHVWVDHNSFSDGNNPDSAQPRYFGEPYQVHDGLLDITNGSDLVTASWNRFADHDKTMLIGSTNNPARDRGKLRVTLHHNDFTNVGQRAPRVRFGQVDVYDNLYRIPSATGYSYSLGVGVESAIYAENNAFLASGVTPADVLYDWGGTVIADIGTRWNGRPVDLVAAYNAEHDPDLAETVGWTPVLRTRVDPALLVPPLVLARSGAGHLG